MDKKHITEEERSVLTKKRWLILAASCMINLCIGSLYAWSVFSSPTAVKLSELSGVTITAAGLSIVFTVANSVGPITLIGGGIVNDKTGPRWVVLLGGILFGTGMIFSAIATNSATLICTYGLGCGLGMGLVYGCTVSNSVKFFPDKRGLIGGIATASYGISSVIVPPVANFMIEKVGVSTTFLILGIIFTIVIAVGAFFIQPCPDGFYPDGYDFSTGDGDKQKHESQKNWKEMLKDPVFYTMIMLLTCGAVFGLMTISQVSPIAQEMIGMSVTSATMSISVLALFNAVGRVAAGYFSDKIGRINTLAVMLTFSIGGLFLLYTAGKGDLIKFYVGISVIGLCFGAFMGVFPGFTADQFGEKNNSVNYGIMFIGFSVAGYLGPTIMSSIYRVEQSYKPAFLVAMLLVIIGISLNFLYRWQMKRIVQ